LKKLKKRDISLPGYYISPNKAYDQLLGRAPGASRLSSRDLVSDLADALAAQQPPIRLLVYLPAGTKIVLVLPSVSL
jgi:hypothetical protein